MVQAAEVELRENVGQELRRGALVLAVLSSLAREQYGYSLKKLLAERGLAVDEGTLYPLLRRLESQGVLTSRWRLEDGRPRRYYQINERGKKLLGQLEGDWRELVRALNGILR